MKVLRIGLARDLGLLVVAFFLSSTSNAVGVGGLVVFGDSLSDTGNLFAATGGTVPPPPYFNGRFSNGLIWVDTLTSSLSISVDNYAVGGAQTGTMNVNDGLPGGPFGGLQDQIADYTGGTVDTTATHIVWAGANNFTTIPADISAAISTSVTELLTAVGNLKAQGVTDIWLINLPDLGLTPRLLDLGLGAQGSALTDAFNGALNTGLAGAGFTDVNVFDSAGALRDIVGDPGAFGFANVTDGCLNDLTCLLSPTVADTYMFWDDIHPTTVTHDILAQRLEVALMHAIPVPAAVWLFASALMALGWARRRVA
ncbi:MAG: SGNH/GDSL hydrolase family protein [Gammaproteobacteria bacterium]|nr:SGNH/GDSL hydrolase family protein [Gammaproteobacteria bacterium]